MGQIKVVAFQHGTKRIEMEGTEGMKIPDICEAAGIKYEGTSFFINGNRVSQAEAASVVVPAGAEVRAAPKGDGGC